MLQMHRCALIGKDEYCGCDNTYSTFPLAVIRLKGKASVHSAQTLKFWSSFFLVPTTNKYQTAQRHKKALRLSLCD